MSGFFPGVMWQLHALTGKPFWAEKAQQWQQNLANNQREFMTQHDFGGCLSRHYVRACMQLLCWWALLAALLCVTNGGVWASLQFEPSTFGPDNDTVQSKKFAMTSCNTCCRGTEATSCVLVYLCVHLQHLLCAGFIYLPTFAHSYSVTHSDEDKRQALAAAEALSWSFNPNANALRTFEGWMPRPPKAWAAQIVIIGEQQHA